MDWAHCLFPAIQTVEVSQGRDAVSLCQRLKTPADSSKGLPANVSVETEAYMHLTELREDCVHTHTHVFMYVCVQEAQNRVESVPHRCSYQNQCWFYDVCLLFLVKKCWFMMVSVCCEEHMWCSYEPQGLYYQPPTTTNLQPSLLAGYYLSRWGVPPFHLLEVSHQQPSPHPQSHGPSVPSKYPNKFKCNATKWDHLHVPFLFNRIYHLTLWPSLTNGTQGDGGDGGWFLMAVTWKRKRERKRGRDTLLPEMALTQLGGVNSPDVFQWNQWNYSPGSARGISSTDVKIIASSQLKFNGSDVVVQDATDMTMPPPPVHQSASASRGHPLPKQHQLTSLACTSRDLIGGGLCHCGCQPGRTSGPAINFHDNAKMHKARAALFYFL